MQHYHEILQKQRDFFHSGATLPLAFRLAQLRKLKAMITAHEQDITAALKQDLNKSAAESIISEILIVTDEIDFLCKKLKSLMRPQKIATRFPILWPGKSQIRHDPYGCVLIIAPWNYPFQLLISPLVGAISAGNCVMLKPSEMSTHTEQLMLKLINTHFTPEYIAAVQAGAEETSLLLQEKFDYIFFTGSTNTGKIIMTAAAKNLTPVTLELGGKSPCIIDATANLDYAARRIAWGKWLNAGQTCIAPDYLYVERSCKDALVAKIKNVIKRYYGDNPATSASYGKIINRKHVERLTHLMQSGHIIYGGQSNLDERYIAPTMIDDITWNDPIMQEEIFGPLLPVMTFDHISDVIRDLKTRPKSLALYLFTKDKITENHILNALSFGGGCINDCILHVANYRLPFGGVGASGMGGYHGEYSFATFSHRKSILKKPWAIDFNLEYPPYNSSKLWWIRQLFKL